MHESVVFVAGCKIFERKYSNVPKGGKEGMIGMSVVVEGRGTIRGEDWIQV